MVMVLWRRPQRYFEIPLPESIGGQGGDIWLFLPSLMRLLVHKNRPCVLEDDL